MIEHGTRRPRIEESLLGVVQQLGELVHDVLRGGALRGRLDADEALDRHRQPHEQPVGEKNGGTTN